MSPLSDRRSSRAEVSTWIAPTVDWTGLRVAAILEAGAEAFREKGYDAVTMTEIAVRSGTTFGSLYRFFPSKEALANALLARYAQSALDRLAELAEQAPTMTPNALAD